MNIKIYGNWKKPYMEGNPMDFKDTDGFYVNKQVKYVLWHFNKLDNILLKRCVGSSPSLM